MNGRVYDPTIGRFMSVDPVFQFPENTQSLNPYSYVLNNPLSLTDPSGFAACSDTEAGSGSGTCTFQQGGKTYTAKYDTKKDGSTAIRTNQLGRALVIGVSNGRQSGQGVAAQPANAKSSLSQASRPNAGSGAPQLEVSAANVPEKSLTTLAPTSTVGTDARTDAASTRSAKEASPAKGQIILLPQQSAGGAPAQITPEIEDRLRNFSEQQGAPINVHSGIRTPEQNRQVGGSPESQHLPGRGAADISIPGVSGNDTAARAFRSGEFGRVNLYPDGRVHVDLQSTGSTRYYEDWNRATPPQ